MTNQIQGELLFSGWGGTSETDYVYTPWMPVAGNIGTFGVQLLVGTGLTLTWNVETRKLDDPTTTTILSANQTISAAGVGTTTSTTNAQELVRYRFSTTSTMSVTDWVVIRALQPSWNSDR